MTHNSTTTRLPRSTSRPVQPHRLVLGTHIAYTQRYARYKTWTRSEWRIVNIPRTNGVSIGYRTIASGRRDYDQGEGFIFIPETYHRVALVAFDLYCNPVHVPIESIEVMG